MTAFEYSPEELPQIVHDKSWPIRDPQGNHDIVHYFITKFAPVEGQDSHDWSFSNVDDADPSYIRTSILAWIAWYEFVMAGKVEQVNNG